MPIQLLPTAINFLGKQLLKTGGKKVFSGATGIDLGIKPSNGNEDETVNLLRRISKSELTYGSECQRNGFHS